MILVIRIRTIFVNVDKKQIIKLNPNYIKLVIFVEKI